MTALFRDKDGTPIDLMEAVDRYSDSEYTQVGFDVLAFPSGHVNVSTVWSPVGLGVLDGELAYFETMVFGGRHFDHWQFRWHDEPEAKAGHAIVVQAVRLDWRPAKLARAIARLQTKGPT